MEPDAQRPREDNDTSFDILSHSFQKQLVPKLDKSSLNSWTQVSKGQSTIRKEFEDRLCMSPPEALLPYVFPPSFEVNKSPQEHRVPPGAGTFEYKDCVYQMHPQLGAVIPDMQTWDEEVIGAYNGTYHSLYLLMTGKDTDFGYNFAAGQRMYENIFLMDRYVHTLARSFGWFVLNAASPPDTQHLIDIARAVR